MSATISRQERRIKDLQAECSSLKEKLLNTEENNDLLEFQILELRDASESVIVHDLISILTLIKMR